MSKVVFQTSPSWETLGTVPTSLPQQAPDTTVQAYNPFGFEITLDFPFGFNSSSVFFPSPAAAPSPDDVVPESIYHNPGAPSSPVWANGSSTQFTTQFNERDGDGPNESDEARLQKCSVEGCDKRYKRAEHKVRHEKGHNEEATYGCHPNCKRKYVVRKSRIDNLRQHAKKHIKGTLMANKIEGIEQWVEEMYPKGNRGGRR
ncbi:hypothetical protein GGTG_13249 [Gaeumannomyces tritici R3-111a-1]|uniref:C2H2-type domain-containing protein n=1 Tax=Gaeumannomyces tritici (strain R3-111a-1) TaxID=644352 RepID=J3PIC1_GAET3|nr:hypothetical protein GGTG_13249 [Gaeumannomyces tritici R3-111a-1]EJT69140.1 hypothetical protein GGTG_13249 [Gaeumannomyces tritici R3-111a-1]